MIILNTTFVADRKILNDALGWIAKTYAAAGAKCSGMDTPPMLARVIDSPDQSTVSYALHLPFATESDARKFDQGAGLSLRVLMYKHFGDNMLSFSTLLEVLEIKDL